MCTFTFTFCIHSSKRDFRSVHLHFHLHRYGAHSSYQPAATFLISSSAAATAAAARLCRMSSEHSNSGSSPTRKGLGLFSSIGRNHRDPSKRHSTAHSFQSSGSDRRSIEGGADDGGGSGSGGGVKQLVGKTLGRRRRKKQELADEQQASEEAARGRSVADRGTLGNYEVGRNEQHGERKLLHDSFDDDDDDDDNRSLSSLLTLDDAPPPSHGSSSSQ